MPALFVFIIAPILFVLLMWVAVTSYRIYYPDRAIPLDQDQKVIRERARRSGNAMPVGFREIREDQRRRFRQRQRTKRKPRYVVGCGSDGVPDGWKEELWKRRN